MSRKAEKPFSPVDEMQLSQPMGNRTAEHFRDALDDLEHEATAQDAKIKQLRQAILQRAQELDTTVCQSWLDSEIEKADHLALEARLEKLIKFLSEK
ncbi:MAG: hypothetical protein WDO70_00315 [Alphaproteobacteria bacterium]